MGDYQLIYADPPWSYNQRAPHKKTSFGGGAGGHYDVMPIGDIEALKVGELAADNCALLMWAVMPQLPACVRVLEAWGFRYSTTAFVWIKTTKDGRPWYGPGYYTGSNVEVVLLGIKGRMPPAERGVYQAINAPHPRENGKIIHSRKPDIFRQEIVRLFGDVPRVELFARTAAPGWDLAGNQVPGGGVLLVPGEPIPIIKGPPADSVPQLPAVAPVADLFNWRQFA